MEDFASDTVVLRLVSAFNIRKLILLDSADRGNKAVAVVTLVFVRVE